MWHIGHYEVVQTSDTDLIWFNAPLYSLHIISEMIFSTNHLAGTSKQNLTPTKIQQKQRLQITTNIFNQN